MSRWRVEVDRGKCLGSGMCAGMAGAHFTLLEGRSHAPADPVDPDDSVLDAADSCPVEAILVRDESTGEVLAPEQE